MKRKFLELSLGIVLLFSASSCEEKDFSSQITITHDTTMQSVVKNTFDVYLSGQNLYFSIEEDCYSIDLRRFYFYPLDVSLYKYGFDGYTADCLGCSAFDQTDNDIRVARLDLKENSDGTYLLDGTVNIKGDPNIYSIKLDNLTDLDDSFEIISSGVPPHAIINQQSFESWYLRRHGNVVDETSLNYKDFSKSGVDSLDIYINDSPSVPIRLQDCELPLEELPQEIDPSYFTKNTTFVAAGFGKILFLQTTLVHDTDTVDEYMSDIAVVQVLRANELGEEKFIACELNVLDGRTYFISVENGVPTFERAVVNQAFALDLPKFAWMIDYQSSEDDLHFAFSRATSYEFSPDSNKLLELPFDSKAGTIDVSKVDVQNEDDMYTLLDSEDKVENLNKYVGGNLPDNTTYLKIGPSLTNPSNLYGSIVKCVLPSVSFSDYASLMVNYRVNIGRDNKFYQWLDDSGYLTASNINGYTGMKLYKDKMTVLDYLDN